MKPATINKRAGELLRDGAIAGQIDSHQQALQKRTQITLESLTAELEADRAAARAVGQFAVAVAASKALMDLHGLKVEDRQNQRPPFEGQTDEQLVERLNTALGEAGYTIQ